MTIEQLKIATSICINSRFYVEASLFNEGKSIDIDFDNINVYLCLPHVFRKGNEAIVKDILIRYGFKGLLVRNLEELFWLNENENLVKNMDIVLDAGVLVFNSESYFLIKDMLNIDVKEIVLNHELNEAEIKNLINTINKQKADIAFTSLVYGRIPMMISANCTKKSLGRCNHVREVTYIEDRYTKKLPVYSECSFCYNVIYNSVPISLHSKAMNLIKKGNCIISFTDESVDMVKNILTFFIDKDIDIPYKEYTTGHFKRGVE